MVRSGGGGGFGPPAERDLEQIAFDVHEGYVSAEAAKRDYGVAIDEDTGQVCVERTKALWR